jgi:hypothetical protein
MMLMVIMVLIMSVEGGGKETCEEISIPMCKEIGYNFTRLPNQFNHQTQDEVRMVTLGTTFRQPKDRKNRILFSKTDL